MSLPARVKKYLDQSGVEYQELAHKTVYTAYDAAQTLKKELKDIAKNLLIQADKTFVLVVVPADKRINLEKLKKVLGVKKVAIPKEQVMVKVLKIKPGAVSSFGKLHQLETWVDRALLKSRQAVFATGSFSDSVLLKVKDFLQLEEAKLANIAMSGNYRIPTRTKKQMVKVTKKVTAKKTAKKSKPAVRKTTAKSKKKKK